MSTLTEREASVVIELFKKRGNWVNQEVFKIQEIGA